MAGETAKLVVPEAGVPNAVVPKVGAVVAGVPNLGAEKLVENN